MSCMQRNRRGQAFRAMLVMLLFVAVAHRVLIKTLPISSRSSNTSTSADDGSQGFFLFSEDDDPDEPQPQQHSATEDPTIIVDEVDEDSSEANDADDDGSDINAAMNELTGAAMGDPPVNSDTGPSVMDAPPGNIVAGDPPVNAVTDDLPHELAQDYLPKTTVKSAPANVAPPVNPANVAPPVVPANVAPPVNPANVAQPVNPANVAPPVNPANVAPPVNPANVAPPVNPANVAQPVVPANIAPPVNPANVAQPVNPANEAQPVNPAKVAPQAPQQPVNPANVASQAPQQPVNLAAIPANAAVPRNFVAVEPAPPPAAYLPLTLPDVTPPSHPVYKVYPINGTAPHVDTSSQFDARVFNPFCNTQPPLRAVLPIYSAVGLFDLRNLLRSTLGRWAKKLNCRIFFIIGVSRNQTVNKLARDEYYREKDILMMDKYDTYRDLNDKAAIMFEWLAKYCMHVPWVIHLIDDAYINIEMWLQRLESIRATGKHNFIVGGLMDRMKAPRNQKLHTFVTMKEYPQQRFPKYAIGFAYAWPASVSRAMVAALHKARYCWIEDVWATGFLREAAHVELLSFKRSEWKANEDKPIPHLLDRLPPWFMIHTVEAALFPKLYSTVAN